MDGLKSTSKSLSEYHPLKTPCACILRAREKPGKIIFTLERKNIMTSPNLEKIIERLDKQLINAQTKVAEIQAHIGALKRVS